MASEVKSAVTDERRYLFDLQGYIHLPGVLDSAEVKRLNEILDEHADDLNILKERREKLQGRELSEEERKELAKVSKDIALSGFSFLTWGEEFRNLVDHPKVLPLLQEWLDPALRMDHFYGIFSTEGTPKHELHLGKTPHVRPAYYWFQNGKIYSGLTVVSWALVDMPSGQGTFACIPGSHKANYPCPPEITRLESNPGCVVEVPMKAGDVVIFTEALTHGAYPWTAAHQRRSVLFKYSPGHMGWMNLDWPDELLELLTPAQRALFDRPYTYDHRGDEPNYRRAIDDPEHIPMLRGT